MKKISFILFCSLVLLTSCKKKDTFWQTDLSAPIVNDTLDLSKLTTDSILVGNGSGFLDLDFTKTLIDFGLSDIVSIPDTEVVQTFHPNFTLNVPPGFDVFNQIEQYSINIPNVQLKNIRVFGGKIKLKVYNPIATGVTFDVYLPGVEKNNVPFHETFTVGAGDNAAPAVVEAELNLAGYEMDLRGTNGILFNTLQSQVVAKTDVNGPTVSVSPSNVFKVEANLSDISVDYARGYFGQQVFSDTSSLNLSYLNQIASGSLDLNAIQLNVTVSNGLKVPLKSKLTLVQNANANGTSVNLSAPCIGQELFLSPATGTWNNLQSATQQVNINSGNSNIEQVVENLGSDLKVGYVVELNPLGNVNAGWDEVFSTSRVKVIMHAQMPLQFQADQLTLVDTFQVNLTQNSSKTHVVGGYFTLDVSNAFPMQSQVKMSFLDASGNMIEEIIGDALILSALTGSLNPNGLLVKNSKVNFQATPQLMNHVNDVKFIGIEAILDTPNSSGTSNQMVSIPVGAFMHVKLKAHLQTEIVY
ncbi:MAG: hypothetical protein WCG64_09090 [Flavobacteriia bacterium]